MHKYKLTVTKIQADIICRSLEILSRLQIGQIEFALNFVPSKNNTFRDLDLLESIEQSYRQFSPESFQHTELSKNAWDLMTVIRHRLAWDNNPNGSSLLGVDYDTPTHFGTEPMANIQRLHDSYLIELTENQAEVIRQALEILSRLQIAQLWAATDYLPSKNSKFRDWDMRTALENAYLPFIPDNLQHSDLEQNAWDLMTTIRHRLAWDNNPDHSGFMGVSFDKPTQFGSEPPAKIEKISH